MTWNAYRHLVFSDLFRVNRQTGWGAVIRQMWGGEEGFRYCFWMRSCAFFRSRPLGRFLLYPISRWRMRHAMYRYGISIEFTTEIGQGFYIGHFGGIIVHPKVRIGRDCNISQGVTLGAANRGERRGVPVIGNRVYIGPGAKIFGNIQIGDDAAIGANAVVTRDVPAGAVAAGVPARIISEAGSADYVTNTDYDAQL